MYSTLNGIIDSQKVRAQKAAMSSQSLGGVASSLAARKTGLRLKCLMRVCSSGIKKCFDEMKSKGSGMKSRGSGTTSTLRPSLSNKLSFRLLT
jgi:hypothetical protein